MPKVKTKNKKNQLRLHNFFIKRVTAMNLECNPLETGGYTVRLVIEGKSAGLLNPISTSATLENIELYQES